MEWYIHDGNRRIGPITADVVRAMVSTGQIKPETLLWRAGMSDWAPASTVSGIFSPPPPPTTPAGSEACTQTGANSSDVSADARRQASLDSVATQSSPSNQRTSAKTSNHRVTALASPWRRYWARFLDLFLFSMLVGVFIGAVRPSLFAPGGLFANPGGEQLASWLFLPLVMILDGLVMGLFGTTPGKAIAGVQTVGISGARLTVGSAIQRNFQLWWYGLGTGFPIVFLFTLIASYRKASRGEQTKWEESSGARSYAHAGFFRTIIAALAFIMLFVGILILSEIGDTTNGVHSGSSRHPSVNATKSLEVELRRAADDLNQNTPQTIDAHTRLDGATAGPGLLFTYHYTLPHFDVDGGLFETLDGFDTDWSDGLRHSVCGDAFLRPLINHGTTIVFEYRDAAGQPVYGFAVRKNDCQP